jgi:hypothetical protein
MTKKHVEKVHFVPIRYRILGGILQGLNIKFGNFIEQLIRNLVEIDPNINVMPHSGKKIKLFFTPATDSLIDSYITNRQIARTIVQNYLISYLIASLRLKVMQKKKIRTGL